MIILPLFNDGDILSCHTGLFDWKLAAKAGLEPKWNEALALETGKRLALILDNTAEIHDVSDKGVTLLAETLNWIGHHCYAQGHSRFEEGSEHHVIYNLEYITSKHFIHILHEKEIPASLLENAKKALTI